MKYNATKAFWASFCLLLALVQFACSRQSENKTQDVETDKISTSTKINEYFIDNAQGESIAAIKIDDSQLIIKMGATEYFGELKRKEKRKYYDQTNQMRYAVKYSESGFKLRDSSEELLWKVKVYDDYLKIADNEEMENPYRIGLSSENNKIKVKKNGQEVVSFRINPLEVHSRINKKYQLINFGSSLGQGVLVIDEIPEVERIIICSEVLKLDK